jgi:hypothetical protein
LGNDQTALNNLAKLFDGDDSTEWASGASTAAATGEFEVTINFVEAVTFNSMVLKKGGSDPFPGVYLNACLTTYDAGDNVVGTDCAEEANGQTGALDSEDSITFSAAGVAVTYAKLTFDTTDGSGAGSGNNGQAVSIKGLEMDFTV